MVKWELLKDATSPEDKPTPGWLFHEISKQLSAEPQCISQAVDYLTQCAQFGLPMVQLKGLVLLGNLIANLPGCVEAVRENEKCIEAIKTLAATEVTVNAGMQEQLLRDRANKVLEQIETGVDARAQAQKEKMKERIHGYGNYEPPPVDENEMDLGPVGKVVGDSIQEVVDDFREKGAVNALKDATLDAVDIVVDGVALVGGFLKSALGKRSASQQQLTGPPLPGERTNSEPHFRVGGSASSHEGNGRQRGRNANNPPPPPPPENISSGSTRSSDTNRKVDGSVSAPDLLGGNSAPNLLGEEETEVVEFDRNADDKSDGGSNNGRSDVDDQEELLTNQILEAGTKMASKKGKNKSGIPKSAIAA